MNPPVIDDKTLKIDETYNFSELNFEINEFCRDLGFKIKTNPPEYESHVVVVNDKKTKTLKVQISMNNVNEPYAV